MSIAFISIFMISIFDKKNQDENKFNQLIKESYLGKLFFDLDNPKPLEIKNWMEKIILQFFQLRKKLESVKGNSQDFYLEKHQQKESML